MSSPLAIAAVTAVLRDLLNNGLIDQDISGVIGGNVTVSTLPPDRVVPEGGDEANQLNLFLHRVTPNTGWNNACLPSRNDRGGRIANPPLALDLHYLLSAYGVDGLHAEILLGYGMHLLHENPILTRGAITEALAGPTGVNGTILPPAFAALSGADLADQVEQIKITPVSLSTEEMSKLWAAIQSHYRPTAAYMISVVLIESNNAARSALPVLSRGAVDPVTGKDSGIRVQSGLIPPFPTLESLTPPNSQVVARMGETVEFSGHHLEATEVLARFTDVRGQRVLELSVVDATRDGFEVTLPSVPPAGAVTPDDPLNPDNWRIGHFGAAAIMRELPAEDRFSNELALTLAPRIEPITVNTVAANTVIEVECAPPVWRGQRVTLVVGSRELPADALVTDRTTILTFRSPTADLPTGNQWVRLRVDGVSSVLIDRSGEFSVFDASQQVNL